ncbi:MAG: hypothetical protein LBR80_09695 [Deltaproteobacteria bacterium]|jgi:hypothetical protein|nr:hypothetical protein [Deltaproteobacteria bacterium]
MSRLQASLPAYAFLMIDLSLKSRGVERASDFKPYASYLRFTARNVPQSKEA